jgi:hypothetical protein
MGTLWSPEEQCYLLDHKEETNKQIAKDMTAIFGREITRVMIRNARRRYNAHRTVHSQESRKKQIYTSPEKELNSAAHRFKPGNVPKNWMPIGTEREIDGSVYVKVKEIPKAKYREMWKLKHHCVWEEANGPIPEGMVCIFLNGNKKDCRLENLMLVTKQECGVATREMGDPEMVKAKVLLTRLENTIEKKERKQ